MKGDCAALSNKKTSFFTTKALSEVVCFYFSEIILSGTVTNHNSVINRPSYIALGLFDYG